MQIEVKYSMGDTVEHIITEKHLRVIGYLVLGRNLQYCCIGDTEGSVKYLLEEEIKGVYERKFIGFVHKDENISKGQVEEVLPLLDVQEKEKGKTVVQKKLPKKEKTRNETVHKRGKL